MKFSIIIPFLNNHSSLIALLESIREMRYDPDEYEIIIADNGSDLKFEWNGGKLPLIIADARGKRSSYFARNSALSLASGEYIAFTDSDCLVHRNWLKEAEKLFSDKDVSAIAGKIIFLFRNSTPSIIEYVDSIRFLRQDVYASKGYGATANLFVKREVFGNSGFFDDSLISGGDFELCLRIRKDGFKLIYGEKTIIYHKARPYLRHLQEKTKRIATGQKILKKKKLLKESIRTVLPVRTIPHNENLKNFNFFDRLLVFVIFNYLHYYNIVKRII